jgi:hypothetical protein
MACSFGSRPQGRRTWNRRVVLRLGAALIGVGIALAALSLLPAVPVVVCCAAWTVSGSGIGTVYPTLSVLVLELSPPQEPGANSSALQVGESVFSGVTVAVTGAPATALARGEVAYVTCFGLVVLITPAGTALAGRYAVRGPERPGG